MGVHFKDNEEKITIGMIIAGIIIIGILLSVLGLLPTTHHCSSPEHYNWFQA